MEHIIVGALASFEDDWHFSHGVRTNGLLPFSGVTGTRADGTRSWPSRTATSSGRIRRGRPSG